MEKVQKFPVLVDVTTVRQFLGLASYYQRFIPGFSKIAEPLNALLKKDVPFQWTRKCQSSFAELKSLLTSAPVLAYPSFGSGKEFILETDASKVGLGAVLAQKQADNRIHPIAHASSSLNPHKKNYGISELETLGLVWAVKHFRAYLLGHRCIVYTDHAACTSLLNRSHPSAKLALMGTCDSRNGLRNSTSIRPSQWLALMRYPGTLLKLQSPKFNPILIQLL